jgi:hypothetical protein
MNNQFQYHTQETINYVIHLHNSGNDERAIADHTGLGFWTVTEILYKSIGYRSTL